MPRCPYARRLLCRRGTGDGLAVEHLDRPIFSEATKVLELAPGHGRNSEKLSGVPGDLPG